MKAISSVKHVRRMAAEILGVGEGRIWIDPEHLKRVSGAISREEVRKLIDDGFIGVRPIKGVSRVRARRRALQRKKGRRKGPGSRKGSRISRKELWMIKVRALRRFLRTLKEKKLIEPKVYRRLYLMVKGGAFRSVAHLKLYLNEHKLIRRI